MSRVHSSSLCSGSLKFDTASETDPRIYWIKDPDSDRDLFFSGSQDTINFIFYFFYYFSSSVFKDNKLLRSQKTIKIKFCIFFAY